MELIVQILMLFIVVNTLLKLSFWKMWQAMIFGLVCAAFVIFTCRYAVLQSKTQIADYLKNVKVMQDVAVLITLESVVYFAFCFASLRGIFGKKTKWWGWLLSYYPGLLVFPVLFYLLTQLIFAMPGTSFATTSYLLAAAVFLGFPLLSHVVKYLYPEKELRLEVHFLVSLFVCAIGLITTVNGNVTYAAAEEPLNLKAIFLSVGLFVLLFFAGAMMSKVKWILFSKKNKQEKHTSR